MFTGEVHVDLMLHEQTCRIAILADDLTSAADAAGPFVAQGMTALIGWETAPLLPAEVVSVNAATRSLAAMQAGARMERFARDLRHAPVLFKTVDSTLRGHVREEIAGALRGSGRCRLVFAPAFPNAGRTTVDGIQLLDGVPVHLSRYGQDPVHPARVSALWELLREATGTATLLDACTQDDLDRSVAGVERPEEVLWVGSPGLARALARRVGTGESPGADFAASNGAALVVVGSANDISHRQAAAIRGGTAKVLLAPRSRKGDPAAVLAQLADEAAAELVTGRFGALIATGGDTMDAILTRMGTGSISLLGEVEPGFPFGLAEIAGRPILLAMKAGGFGDDMTLERAARHLCTFIKEPAP